MHSWMCSYYIHTTIMNYDYFRRLGRNILKILHVGVGYKPYKEKKYINSECVDVE